MEFLRLKVFKTSFLILLGVVCLWIISDAIHKHQLKLQAASNEWKANQLFPRTWKDIVKHDTLRAVCGYNHTDYFVNGDTVGGFQYEMIHAFAKDYGLQVVITPEMNKDQQVVDLLKGKYDLIIGPIATTKEMNDSLLCTIPIIRMRQLLIQRKRDPSTTQQDVELGSMSPYINSLYQLGGRHITVANDSAAISRVRHLSEEVGEPIYVDIVKHYGAEQLMQMVAHKEIDYAVAPENIAMALIDSLPQLDLNKPISFTQLYSWGVPARDSVLLEVLNRWLSRKLQSREYKALYKKYHLEK